MLSTSADTHSDRVHACRGCHCCCRRRREATKQASDAPLDKMILAATEYIKAETERRKEGNTSGHKRRSEGGDGEKKNHNNANENADTSRNTCGGCRRRRKGKGLERHHSYSDDHHHRSGSDAQAQREATGMDTLPPPRRPPPRHTMAGANCTSCIPLCRY